MKWSVAQLGWKSSSNLTEAAKPNNKRPTNSPNILDIVVTKSSSLNSRRRKKIQKKGQILWNWEMNRVKWSFYRNAFSVRTNEGGLWVLSIIYSPVHWLFHSFHVTVPCHVPRLGFQIPRNEQKLQNIDWCDIKKYSRYCGSDSWQKLFTESV